MQQQPNNPYDQYKQQSLSTLAPGEVLVKLFEELIKQCRLGVIAIEEKDLGKANGALTKAQTIVATLSNSLDMRYPIAKELKDMYVFLAQQLLLANVRKNTKIINDCLPIMKDLRDSFDQAEKISRQQQAQAAAAAIGRQPQPQPVGGHAV